MSIDVNTIYKTLDSDISIEQAKVLLKRYMLDQVREYGRHPEQRRNIAYGMAGMLAIDKIRHLPNDDPYVEVLDMAGRLELPERHHGYATWEELIERIKALP